MTYYCPACDSTIERPGEKAATIKSYCSSTGKDVRLIRKKGTQ